MSDRCYMELNCRRQDMQKFEDLGFVAQDWNHEPDSPLVTMAEEDADYAHADDMPTDIPYYGYNGCGGDYGDGAFACDGKTFAEVETGHNGRFLVDWDIKKQRPYRCSLGQIHRYIKVRNKVDKLFARLKKSKPAKQKLTT